MISPLILIAYDTQSPVDRLLQAFSESRRAHGIAWDVHPFVEANPHILCHRIDKWALANESHRNISLLITDVRFGEQEPHAGIAVVMPSLTQFWQDQKWIRSGCWPWDDLILATIYPGTSGREREDFYSAAKESSIPDDRIMMNSSQYHANMIVERARELLGL